MGARRQLPGTRRSARSQPNIVDKQLVTGMHSLENQPGHHRRVDWPQARSSRERAFLGKLKRNCLVVGKRTDWLPETYPLRSALTL